MSFYHYIILCFYFLIISCFYFDNVLMCIMKTINSFQFNSKYSETRKKFKAGDFVLLDRPSKREMDYVWPVSKPKERHAQILTLTNWQFVEVLVRSELINKTDHIENLCHGRFVGCACVSCYTLTPSVSVLSYSKCSDTRYVRALSSGNWIFLRRTKWS